VAERRCLACKRHFWQKTGQHVYCTVACRDAGQRVNGRARHGFQHQRERAAWAAVVATGTVQCARCRLLTEPGSR
jgi:hypothetical protein